MQQQVRWRSKKAADIKRNKKKKKKRNQNRKGRGNANENCQQQTDTAVASCPPRVIYPDEDCFSTKKDQSSEIFEAKREREREKKTETMED